MDKEIKIKEYIERIHKAKQEIEFCNNEIDKINGLTEICPHCKGEGKFMSIHRFMGNHSYINCHICRGKGKITKEELDEFNKDQDM